MKTGMKILNCEKTRAMWVSCLVKNELNGRLNLQANQRGETRSRAKMVSKINGKVGYIFS
jgi:hypothetical protein